MEESSSPSPLFSMSQRYTFNQYRNFKTIGPISNVLPPNVEWKQIRDFELKKLVKLFVVADFEREKSQTHVHRIVDSILHNTFFDNVIRVVKREDGKLEVIDGQHRLAALWLAHTQFGLEKYDIALQIFESDYARTIYRKINMGKRLAMGDHTKAIDDGSIDFFNSLRHTLVHKQTPNKYSFIGILTALKYAKTGDARSISIDELDIVVSQITKEDSDFCFKFCDAMTILSPHVAQSQYYRVSLYRNLFKISYENKFDTKTIISFGEGAMKNKIVKESMKLRTDESFEIVYNELIENVLPEMSLSVQSP